MTNEIKLKITIDGKEAIASLQLTDANIKELYKSFKKKSNLMEIANVLF
jgi:hypothetical protein